jgi:membrane fusion protein (multidrug efflux system)
LNRRRSVFFAALSALALAFVAGCALLVLAKAGPSRAGASPGVARAPQPSAEDGPNDRGAVVVSLALASSRPFVDRIDVLGVAKGRRSVTITSNTTALVTTLHFTDGQTVQEGQVLVDLRALVENAGVADAEAKLSLATSNYNRWKSLGDRGIAAKATVEQYKSALDQAKAGLDEAKAKVGDHVIRAPFSGVVGLSDIAPGALVNPGTPIVSLDDLSVVRVDFDVPDRYLDVLREGLPITARTEAGSDRVERGRIAYIDTRVDQETRAVKARAEFPNADGRLKPGVLMHVAVDKSERDALAVPESAIQYEGDLTFVFVIVRHGPRMLAEQRQVLVGAVQDGFAEIRSGLKPGEEVVADGVNRVSPGQTLRLASSDDTSDAGEPHPGSGAPAR